MSRLAATLIIGTSVLLAGCASTVQKNSKDPYEEYNRKVFEFNMDLTQALLKPTVKAYDTVVPGPARTGIHNFFGNVMMVPTILNDGLQGNFRWMFRDMGRFILNSTLGLLGTIDVASDVGLMPRTQSFGLTFAKWGIRKSPYVMLPFLGPSTVRGSFGLVPDFFTNPVTYIEPDRDYFIVRGVQLIQNASDVLPHEELLQSFAIDPYVAVRSAYMQNREYLVKRVLAETPDHVRSNVHHEDNLLSS